MPVTPTYPGVYIEEVPSGVTAITGVATSITAFVGSALRGPTNDPIMLASFGDFERQFGGIWAKSALGYVVQSFYLNGGSQALIVRVACSNASAAQISLPADTTTVYSPPIVGTPLVLEAASPGEWGNNLQVAVDFPSDTSNITGFHLYIYERVNGTDVAAEKFFNLSVNPADANYVGRVLEFGSSLVRVLTDASVRPQTTCPITSPPTPPSRVSVTTPGNDGDTNGDGTGDVISDVELLGHQGDKSGIYALDHADLFNILSIPPAVPGGDTSANTYQNALTYCVGRRAMLLVDPPIAWGSNSAMAAQNAIDGLPTLGLAGAVARNAALYMPRLVAPNAALGNLPSDLVPSGAIAGLMAQTDARRGIWKAPAGLEAAILGISGLQTNLTDAENGRLNPLGINCLRNFGVGGRVIWGARTMRGADEFGDDYKYVPVRRLALFLEESLYRGTQWAVFEPNSEPLWGELRLSIGGFMHQLFRQGAFFGTSAREAYLVKVDSETTTQTDIDNGIVNILVGFAPLKPAEFIMIRIQQLAGQTET